MEWQNPNGKYPVLPMGTFGLPEDKVPAIEVLAKYDGDLPTIADAVYEANGIGGSFHIKDDVPPFGEVIAWRYRMSETEEIERFLGQGQGGLSEH